MLVKVLQRVFHGDDMLFLGSIDGVNDAGKGGGFSAAGRAGDQHQPPGKSSEADDRVRNSQGLRIRQIKGDDPDDSSHGTALHIGADPKTGQARHSERKIIVSPRQKAGDIPSFRQFINLSEQFFGVRRHQAFLPGRLDAAVFFAGKGTSGYDKEIGRAHFNGLFQKI